MELIVCFATIFLYSYFFVPFKQDNPITKPRSIAFDPKYIKKTLEYALEKEQIQPILL